MAYSFVFIQGVRELSQLGSPEQVISVLCAVVQVCIITIILSVEVTAIMKTLLLSCSTTAMLWRVSVKPC